MPSPEIGLKLLAIALLCTSCALAAADGEWDYDHPELWGEGFPDCAVGEEQSPINIVNAVFDSTLEPPTYNAVGDGCRAWKQGMTTSTFKADLELCAGTLSLEYGRKTYQMLQLHLHSPSEHEIGGGFFDAELHMVHQADDGSYLVVGVLLEEGGDLAPNSFMETFYNAGLNNGDAVIEASADPLHPYDSILPGDPSFYTYPGSFTTPPCTEGVTWVLYANPVQISRQQLDVYRQAVNETLIASSEGNNNRPVEPLHARQVRMYGASTDISVVGAPASTSSQSGDSDGEDIAKLAVGLSVAFICVVAFLMYKMSGMHSRITSMQNTIEKLEKKAGRPQSMSSQVTPLSAAAGGADRHSVVRSSLQQALDDRQQEVQAMREQIGPSDFKIQP